MCWLRTVSHYVRTVAPMGGASSFRGETWDNEESETVSRRATSSDRYSSKLRMRISAPTVWTECSSSVAEISKL